MNLKDILAISGEHGLFRFKAQGKNAIIVEDLETGRRTSAFSSAKVSSLEDISIFTEKEDMPLGKVFDTIFEKENGGPCLDAKAPSDQLKSYFGTVLPDYNRDKVYVSDIKKVLLWYNLLQRLDLLVRDEPVKAENNDGAEKPSEETSVQDDSKE